MIWSPWGTLWQPHLKSRGIYTNKEESAQHLVPTLLALGRQISNLVLFPCPPLTKILPSHRLITTPHYNCQIASYNTRSKVVGPFCSLFHPFFLFLFFFLFWGFSTEFRILLYSSSMALSCHLSQPFRLDLRISQVVGFQSPLAIWYITLTNIYIL